MDVDLGFEFLAHLIVLHFLSFFWGESHTSQIKLASADESSQCFPTIFSNGVVFFLKVGK